MKTDRLAEKVLFLSVGGALCAALYSKWWSLGKVGRRSLGAVVWQWLVGESIVIPFVEVTQRGRPICPILDRDRPSSQLLSGESGGGGRSQVAPF